MKNVGRSIFSFNIFLSSKDVWHFLCRNKFVSYIFLGTSKKILFSLFLKFDYIKVLGKTRQLELIDEKLENNFLFFLCTWI